MTNTLTEYQAPNHSGPIPALGSIVMDGAATVQLGFIPSFVIIMSDTGGTDTCIFWVNSLGAFTPLINANFSVGAGSAVAAYNGTTHTADAAGTKAGFTITGAAYYGTVYYVAFP